MSSNTAEKPSDEKSPVTGDRGASTAGNGTLPDAAPLDVRRHPVLFFDGVCGLCNHFVDFMLQRDSQGLFHFAPLQGTTAQTHLNADDVANLKSVVLMDEAGTHRHSTAVVRILRHMGVGWKIAAFLMWLVPYPLRDIGYKLIARFRYRIFGKKDTCRMPTAEQRQRFLP